LTTQEPQEITAIDLQRAIEFYLRVFQCEVESFADGTCWFKTPDIDGRGGAMVVIRARTPRDGSVVGYFRVGSLEEILARVLREGGKVLIGKSPVGGSALFAYCQDTEGNRFTLEQPGSPDLPGDGGCD
jgi:predicted enzyme related to lactoylglutathione lyase